MTNHSEESMSATGAASKSAARVVGRTRFIAIVPVAGPQPDASGERCGYKRSFSPDLPPGRPAFARPPSDACAKWRAGDVVIGQRLVVARLARTGGFGDSTHRRVAVALTGSRAVTRQAPPASYSRASEPA